MRREERKSKTDSDTLMGLALLDLVNSNARVNRPMSQTLKFISETYAVRLSAKQHGSCCLCRSEAFCEVWSGEYMDGPGKRRLWRSFCQKHMSPKERKASEALV